MKRAILGPLALALSLSSASADQPDLHSAATWLERCKAPKYSFGNNACIFYVMGMIDQESTDGKLYCPPKDAILGDEVAIVIGDLERQPLDMLKMPFAWLAVGALKRNYPCPETK